jgi:hypothetical protein
VYVEQASSPQLVGIAGIVAMETENTFKIVRENDAVCTVPKRGCIFRVCVGTTPPLTTTPHYRIKYVMKQVPPCCVCMAERYASAARTEPARSSRARENLRCCDQCKQRVRQGLLFALILSQPHPTHPALCSPRQAYLHTTRFIKYWRAKHESARDACT